MPVWFRLVRLRVETVGSDGVAVVGAKCDLTNDYGTFSVVTPASVIVHKSSKDLQVICKKDGLVDATANVTSRVTGSMFGNIILGGGIGAIVDHSVTTQPNFRQADWIQPKPGLGGVPLKVATSASKTLAPCLCMVAQ